MADKRISVLDVATTTAGMYVALDKPGATEAVRLAVSYLLPGSIYRCNEVSLSAGEVTVSFLEAFPAGTVYVLLPLPGYSSESGYLYAEPTDKTVSGFKINFVEAVTYVYVAIVVR